MKYRYLSLILVFTSNLAYGVTVPLELQKFFTAKGRTDITRKLEGVPVLQSNAFVEQLSKDQPKLLGGGYFGLVFRGETSGDVYKFSHFIFSHLGFAPLNPARSTIDLDQPFEPAWKDLLRLPQIKDLKAYEPFAGHPMGAVPVLEELYGEALWAIYNGATEAPSLATNISNDGFALRRKFIRGIPFDQILKNKQETKNIWKQLVEWQKRAEQMLIETGVTVDMLTPGNFLVQGEGEHAKLVPFDSGLVKPSKEAVALYAKRGITIPDSSALFGNAIKSATTWPVLPENVVYSRTWQISFDQALEYISALTGQTRLRRLVRHLSRIQPLPIDAAPFLLKPSYIEECQKLLTEQR